jgi:hypothetical protein
MDKSITQHSDINFYSESLRHIAVNENGKDIYASDLEILLGFLLKQTGGTNLWEQAGLDSYLLTLLSTLVMETFRFLLGFRY